MWFSYIIDTIMIISFIYCVIKSIKEKKYIDIILTILLIPFFIFMSSNIYLGGTAFNDAKTAYEFYQEGHYYLCSHNAYTEVTAAQYNYMKFIQIFSYGSLGLMLLLMFIFKLRKV